MYTDSETYACTSTSSTEAVTQWGWAHCCFNLLRQLSLSELPALAARSIGFLSRSPGSYGGWGWIAGTSCVWVGGCGRGGWEKNNRARDKMSAFHVVFEVEGEQMLAEIWLLEVQPSRGHYARQIIGLWRGGTRHPQPLSRTPPLMTDPPPVSRWPDLC